MANVITSIRIVCALALLFCPALSAPFYMLYIIAGFTDMIDGTVARKTGTISEFGSKLDTVADFILVIVCLIKLIPVLNMQPSSLPSEKMLPEPQHIGYCSVTERIISPWGAVEIGE